MYTTHVKLLPVYRVVHRMCKDLQSWLEHGAAWWSLVQPFAPWSGLFKTDLACNGLVESSNYPPSLVYTPIGQDWAGLRFAGVYWALVGCIGLWWAVLCCDGLCWATRDSTVLKPEHVHVKLLAVYTKSCKTIARIGHNCSSVES